MFLQGYFYWSGVVFNALVLASFLIGILFTVRSWRIEGEIRKKYGVAVQSVTFDKPEEGETNEENTGKR